MHATGGLCLANSEPRGIRQRFRVGDMGQGRGGQRMYNPLVIDSNAPGVPMILKGYGCFVSPFLFFHDIVDQKLTIVFVFDCCSTQRSSSIPHHRHHRGGIQIIGYRPFL